MRLRYKLLIVVVALGASFATGRYTVPVKIVTQIKTVTVEKVVTDTDTSKHQVVTKKEIDKPDGTKEITTVTTDDTSKKTDSVATNNTQTDEIKTVVKDGKRLNISALAGVDVIAPRGIIFGGHVSTNLVGPLTVGLFALTDATVGCSLGLSF